MNGTDILLLLRLPPPYGGGEILSSYLAEHFAERPRYHLLSYRIRGGTKASQGRLRFSNVLWGLFIIARTVYLLLRLRPRVVYLTLPKSFLPFLRTGCIIGLARILGVKVLASLVGASIQYLESGGARRSMGLPFLRKIHSIRVEAEIVRQHLARHGLERCIVMDNGTRIPPIIAKSRDVIEATPLNLLYVGALNPAKGIKTLIHSLPMCRQAGARVHLHLIGEWSDPTAKGEIEHFIRAQSLEDQVSFHGRVIEERKWDIFARCAILTHPTYWDGQPISILEAMGCGLAVIATPIGAIPETMSDQTNGIILTENTPQQLSAAILRFYGDRQYLQQVSARNIETYRERFSVEVFCRRTEEWIESAVED